MLALPASSSVLGMPDPDASLLGRKRRLPRETTTVAISCPLPGGVLTLTVNKNENKKRASPVKLAYWRAAALLILVVGWWIGEASADPTWFTPAPRSESRAAVVRKLLLGPPHGLLRSIPALRMHSHQHPQRAGDGTSSVLEYTTEVSTKVRKRVQSAAEDVLRGAKGSLSSSGLYYGVSPESLQRHAGSGGGANGERGSKKVLASPPPPPRRKGMRDTMSETLEELRLMRQEMEELRKELHEMQSKVRIGAADDLVTEGDSDDDAAAAEAKRRKRVREFEQISAEIERWAESALDEGEEDGWAEVKCNKMFQNMNRDGRTRAYLKWMKDSRGKFSDPDDEREYPCIKMYSTIDAPLEEVCLYLSQPQYKDEYNDLIDRHKDLEELTSHSKVCHGQTPQILFLKPRDFVTYCSHRWLRDGTQVVVNQACHDDTGTVAHKDRPMAYAIRGANFISRHPDDPDKTRICMLAHGNPGRDVPMWAIKTAVNSLVPIEPFKLFHKINQGVLNNREELEQASRRVEEMELVSTGGISRRPAGLAQLGYACFWPDGGGVQEGGAAALRMQQQNQLQAKQSVLGIESDLPAQNSSFGSSSASGRDSDELAGRNSNESIEDLGSPGVNEMNTEALQTAMEAADGVPQYVQQEQSVANLVPAMAES